MRRAGKKASKHKMTRGKRHMQEHVRNRQHRRIEKELDREIDKIFLGNLRDHDDPDGEYD